MTHHPWRGAFALALALSALTACGRPNQDACQAYVEHLQGLECVVEDIDGASYCPENLDEPGAPDCADFYACMVEQTSCEDGALVQNGLDACDACKAN